MASDSHMRSNRDNNGNVLGHTRTPISPIVVPWPAQNMPQEKKIPTQNQFTTGTNHLPGRLREKKAANASSRLWSAGIDLPAASGRRVMRRVWRGNSVFENFRRVRESGMLGLREAVSMLAAGSTPARLSRNFRCSETGNFSAGNFLGRDSHKWFDCFLTARNSSLTRVGPKSRTVRARRPRNLWRWSQSESTGQATWSLRRGGILATRDNTQPAGGSTLERHDDPGGPGGPSGERCRTCNISGTGATPRRWRRLWRSSGRNTRQRPGDQDSTRPRRSRGVALATGSARGPWVANRGRCRVRPCRSCPHRRLG